MTLRWSQPARARRADWLRSPWKNLRRESKTKEEDKMTMQEIETQTNQAKIVSEAEWLVARKDLLAREKEFTRLRDELTEHRRELPWVKLEKNYVFEGREGKETLADLFDGRSQLIVYHFMLG